MTSPYEDTQKMASEVYKNIKASEKKFNAKIRELQSGVDLNNVRDDIGTRILATYVTHLINSSVLLSHAAMELVRILPIEERGRNETAIQLQGRDV